MEEWVSLSQLGFSNYQVSKNGYVRNSKTLRVLQRKQKGRIPHIKLSLRRDDGIIKEISIRELVLRTFIGPPTNELYDIIHVDNNPLNSNITNLRWGIKGENTIIKKEKYQDPYINSFEGWKSCLNAGYPDYMASSLGRIYSKLTGKILEGTTQSGYITHNISDGTKFNRIFAHRLICYAFHGFPIDSTYTVDHINRIRTDNRPDNLRWASKRLQAENRGVYTKHISKVVEIKEGKIINTYTKEEAKELVLITKSSLYYGTEINGSLWIYYDSLPIIGEEWKQLILDDKVIGISNMGRVCYSNGKKIYGSKNANGYKIIKLNNSHLVHRLVVTAFIRPLINQEEVNHKNANKEDNRLENLEIVDHKTNMILGVYTGRKDSKAVQQLDMAGNLIAIFPSMREASRLTDIDYSGIQHCAKGMIKTSGGYKWKYVDTS